MKSRLVPSMFTQLVKVTLSIIVYSQTSSSLLSCLDYSSPPTRSTGFAGRSGPVPKMPTLRKSCGVRVVAAITHAIVSGLAVIFVFITRCVARADVVIGAHNAVAIKKP